MQKTTKSNNNKTKPLVGGIGAAIALIVASVFTLEGGYSNHPADTGGATKFGITEQVARDYGYQGSMQDLPKELAQQIYEEEYVARPAFDEVIALSPPVGHKLVDAGVNTGTKRAALWFQISLNALNRGGKDYHQIKEDGYIGPASLSAMASLVEVRGYTKACELLIKLLDIQQGYHYLNLPKHRDFTVGWIENRIQNVSLEACNE